MAESNKDWDYTSGPDDSPSRRRGSDETLTWSASEYIDHNQGPLWFLSLTVVTVALAAGIYFWTRDYVAVGVIVALGTVVGLFAVHKPRKVTYDLSVDGLKIDGKIYAFSIFKSFSIINDGALLSLNLEPVKRFMAPISVYFAPNDQAKVLDIIGNRLPYADKKLDTVERLSRRLRF